MRKYRRWQCPNGRRWISGPSWLGLIHGPGADVVDLLYVDDKDPSIADLASFRCLTHDTNDVIDLAIVGDNLDHRFGQEAYLVFQTSVNNRLSFLTPMSTDIRHCKSRCHAFDPFDETIELLRADDALDQFHRWDCVTKQPAREAR